MIQWDTVTKTIYLYIIGLFMTNTQVSNLLCDGEKAARGRSSRVTISKHQAETPQEDVM